MSRSGLASPVSVVNVSLFVSEISERCSYYHRCKDLESMSSLVGDMLCTRASIAASECLQGVLVRERDEHAHLVSSLRAMIASLQSSGDTESQLRSQLITLAEKVAVLTAAQVCPKRSDCAADAFEEHCWVTFSARHIVCYEQTAGNAIVPHLDCS